MPSLDPVTARGPRKPALGAAAEPVQHRSPLVAWYRKEHLGNIAEGKDSDSEGQEGEPGDVAKAGFRAGHGSNNAGR